MATLRPFALRKFPLTTHALSTPVPLQHRACRTAQYHGLLAQLAHPVSTRCVPPWHTAGPTTATYASHTHARSSRLGLGQHGPRARSAQHTLQAHPSGSLYVDPSRPSGVGQQRNGGGTPAETTPPMERLWSTQPPPRAVAVLIGQPTHARSRSHPREHAVSTAAACMRAQHIRTAHPRRPTAPTAPTAPTRAWHLCSRSDRAQLFGSGTAVQPVDAVHRIVSRTHTVGSEHAQGLDVTTDNRTE